MATPTPATYTRPAGQRLYGGKPRPSVAQALAGAASGAAAASGALSTAAGGGGASRTWSQVSGNEGYRVIWSATSQAAAVGSIESIAALYASSADTATNVNSYAIPATGTIYWRVAVLINGYPQRWSEELSYSA